MKLRFGLELTDADGLFEKEIALTLDTLGEIPLGLTMADEVNGAESVLMLHESFNYELLLAEFNEIILSR